MIGYGQHIAEIYRNYKVFRHGHKVFEQTGETPKQAYHAMRKLYGLTNGRFNEWMAKKTAKVHPQYTDLKPHGVLGNLTDADVKTAIDTMNRDGFYQFPQLLPPDVVAEMMRFATSTPAGWLIPNTDPNVKFNSQWSEDRKIVDVNDPISPVYHFDRIHLFENETISKLFFDPTFLLLAQKYLGMAPVMDHVGMWWSFPFGGISKAEAAQMYHYDMDRLKFVKFLMYLTDVGPDNGPHCYVKGSQHKKPKELLLDSRKTDEEVEKAYGSDRMTEIYGKAGTVLMVDTSGFHKGKTGTEGKRLMFQIEFANSMFGQNYAPVELNDTIRGYSNGMIEKYPHTYGPIFGGG